MCTCCRYTITIVRVTAHHQQQSEVLTYSPHQGYVYTKSKVQTSSAHLCTWLTQETSSLIVFTLWWLHHEPVPWTTQPRFMLAGPGQDSHVGQTCCSPLWWAAVLCWLVTCCAMRSFRQIGIACQSKVPRSFASTRLVWTFTARVVLFLILYGINWYRGNSFGSTHWNPNLPPLLLLH